MRARKEHSGSAPETRLSRAFALNIFRRRTYRRLAQVVAIDIFLQKSHFGISVSHLNLWNGHPVFRISNFTAWSRYIEPLGARNAVR
jgi:hypothetical protein